MRIIQTNIKSGQTAICREEHIWPVEDYLKGDTTKNVIFLLIISVGRLEATASADGDIGRSSQLDHSKELDLKFSELYWSSFLDSVQKNRYRNKMA